MGNAASLDHDGPGPQPAPAQGLGAPEPGKRTAPKTPRRPGEDEVAALVPPPTGAPRHDNPHPDRPADAAADPELGAAAPPPELDPEQDATRVIETSKRLVKAWERRRTAADAARRFTVTIQPVVGGEGAAFQLDDIAPDTLVGEVKQRVHDAPPSPPVNRGRAWAARKRATPDQQRLVAMDQGQLVLEDESLPIGACIDTTAAADVTLHLAMQDADAAAARRARRIEIRVRAAAARAAAQARWEARKSKAKSAGAVTSGMGVALLVVYLAAGCREDDTCSERGACSGLVAHCTCDEGFVGEHCEMDALTECGCGDHGVQTGFEAIADALAQQQQATFQSSDSVSCPVTDDGRCVTSRNHPSDYDRGDDCTITLIGAATVSSVGTFSPYDYSSAYPYSNDYLTIGGTRYSGWTSGPSGVSVTAVTIIDWQTNDYGTSAGFKLCIDGVDAAVRGICSAGTCACEGDFIGELCDTECGCGAHGTQTGIEAAREANSCSAGTCTCGGDYIGDYCWAECSCNGRGNQTDIDAARAAGTCSAGSCTCEGNWAGELCERSCGYPWTRDIHGTSDGHICTCEGNWIGEFCDVECGCSDHGNQTDIEAARAAGSCSAGSCACEGNWVGESCYRECGCSGRGVQTDIEAARAAGSCSAGSCACEANWAGEFCERICVHGTSDGHSCTCEGNWVGEFCDTECGCGEHGIQTGIEAARAANSCSAGTCTCEADFIGEHCDTECGCSGHGVQTGIEAARFADIPASLTSSDSSSCPVVEGGRCVTSRNYPSDYRSGDSCTITARESGTVSTEGTFYTYYSTDGYYAYYSDYLTIGGNRYHGHWGPSGVSVADGASITWQTDGSYTSAGFKICIHRRHLGSCAAGSCACEGDYGGDFCEIWYRPSYTLSGCPDPSFCGVFERTNTTCDGLLAYQQQRGGLALYQIGHHGGSVWYVGPGARLDDCDTRFRYMWSGMASAQQAPDHHGYAGWKRCTSHGNGGQCLSFEPAPVTIA